MASCAALLRVHKNIDKSAQLTRDEENCFLNCCAHIQAGRTRPVHIKTNLQADCNQACARQNDTLHPVTTLHHLTQLDENREDDQAREPER